MTFANMAKRLARKAGIEMHWYNPAQSEDARLSRLLGYHCIDTVIDVGANNGGYGSSLREGGYAGAIVSFEPLQDAYTKLVEVAARSNDWHVMPRMALGAEDGEVEINVAGNSTSSSVLPMYDNHVGAAPQSRYVSKQQVLLRRLDGVEHKAIRQGRRILLKIDTQGYEMPVLIGAENLLDRIHGLQIELSLIPLYEGQKLYLDLIAWLSGKGFELWNVIPGFVDQGSGRLLQMDGIFFRKLS
jgi:FkbM family methyltransferase